MVAGAFSTFCASTGATLLWQFAVRHVDQGYFAHTLRQESELDPSKTYLFVAHPHGLLTISHHQQNSILTMGNISLY
ncbi:hypothetical protein AaE_008422 [Aphanomyces astaci]|uniref:Uncharacterized protein n=1 Tax=Aphanomyces astaci TaxID=112090 RepID=A0A6A4ZUX8_APHAT|nr:hypothetical protein AaE_008422 [Aphanomyces astaci]